MSCVLRLRGPGLSAALAKVAIEPYRMESGVAHFGVSGATFDGLAGQTQDAIAFLRAHDSDLRALLSAGGVTGELDFATEYRDGVFHSYLLPAQLVQAAGLLGLDVVVSSYPTDEVSSVA